MRLFAVFALFAFAFADASCVFHKHTLYTKESVNACLDQIPFDRDNALEHSNEIVQVLNAHAFHDHLVFPPPGFEHLQMNLTAEVEAIGDALPATGTAGAFREFHETVGALMRRQRDPHAVFAKPRCLGTFVNILPMGLDLVQVKEGEFPDFTTELNLEIAQLPPSRRWATAAWDAEHGTDLAARIEGENRLARTLDTINGIPAREFILQTALELGYISKDDQAMYLSWLGSDFFHRSNLVYNHAPEGNTKYGGAPEMVLGFRDGSSVTVAYRLYTLRDAEYDSLDQFIDLCGFNNTFVAAAGEQRTFTEQLTKTHRRMHEDLTMLREESEEVRANAVASGFEPHTEAEIRAFNEEWLADAPDVPYSGDSQAYADIDNKYAFQMKHVSRIGHASLDEISTFSLDNGMRRVLVVHVASFSPEEPAAFAEAIYAAADLAALSTEKGRPYDKFAVSVLGNGGGIISYGYLLANVLGGVGRTHYDTGADPTSAYAPHRLFPLAGPYDVVASGLVGADALEMQRYLNETSYLSILDEDQLRVRHFRDAAGKDVAHTRTYSGIGSLGIEQPGTDAPTDVLLQAAKHMAHAFQSHDDVLVFTDGTCGSTCSTFINRVAGPVEGESHLAKVVAIGGIDTGKYKDATMFPSSFPGGCVLDSQFIAESTDGRVGVMPSNAYLRFPGAALYAFQASAEDVIPVPLEFSDYSYQTDYQFKQAFVSPAALGSSDISVQRTAIARLISVPSQDTFEGVTGWSRGPGDKCAVEHGLGGRMADPKLKLYTGECAVVVCDYGYIVDRDTATCAEYLPHSQPDGKHDNKAEYMALYVVIGVIGVLTAGLLVAWIVYAIRARRASSSEFTSLLNDEENN